MHVYSHQPANGFCLIITTNGDSFDGGLGMSLFRDTRGVCLQNTTCIVRLYTYVCIVITLTGNKK